MKGQNLDFEALDRLPDPRKFFEDNYDKLANFLVDLENETILDTVMDPAQVGRAGDSSVLHNHDTVDLVEIPVDGAGQAEYGMAVIENYKWNNSVQKFVLVKRDTAGSAQVLENKRFGNDLENAILAKLSPLQRKKYTDYNGAVTWSFHTTLNKNYEQRLVVDAEATHPKKEDPSLSISAQVRIVRKADGVQIVVESASLR